MAGLYGVYFLNRNIPSNIYNMFFSSEHKNIINYENKVDNFIYGRSVLNKFLNDRVLFQNDKYVLALEGIMYNKETSSSAETIIKWYENEGTEFVKKIDGLFSGFLYDQRKQTIYVFTDYLSTKPIYYYLDKINNLFVFASELKVLTALLDRLKLKIEFDRDAIYALLTFGYMLNNWTIVKEIKRLDHACFISFDCKSFRLSQNKYFYVDWHKKEISLQDAIDTLDYLLPNAIKKVWNKDAEYDYKHYALLSGGLDSRINVLLAQEFGYVPEAVITFAKAGNSDHKIAKQISKRNNLNHFFFDLDNGSYMLDNMQEFTLANDGLVMIIGAAHLYDSIRKFDLNDNWGQLHTGQIGDFLFGSHKVTNFKNIVHRIGYLKEKDYIAKINGYNNILMNYTGEAAYEQFLLEQKIINGVFNGDRIVSNFTDSSSPYYDRELLSFCMSLPLRFKKNEHIIIEYLKQKYPFVLDFKWEKIGIKPRNMFLVDIAKNVRRYKEGIAKRLGVTSDHMNPYHVWIKQNQQLASNFNEVMNKLLPEVDDAELHMDLLNVFHSSNPMGKYSVITVLLSLNQHFWKKEINI